MILRAFQSRVAFDTFDNRYATDFSLTLRYKHRDYKYNRLSRTILCAADDNKHSETALEWLFDDLAEDGDEIICLRVIDPSDKLSIVDSSLEEKQYRYEANRFLKHIMLKNGNSKKISLVLEFAMGKVHEMIQRMIEIYEPAMLVVGTRGKSMDGFKGLLPGSISKYCLQHSPVPVVVVRPSQKREKKKAKREADPTRRAYRDVLSVDDGSNDVSVYTEGCTNTLSVPKIPHYLQTNQSFTREPSVDRQPRSTMRDPKQKILQEQQQQRSRSPFANFGVDLSRLSLNSYWSNSDVN